MNRVAVRIARLTLSVAVIAICSGCGEIVYDSKTAPRPLLAGLEPSDQDAAFFREHNLQQFGCPTVFQAPCGLECIPFTHRTVILKEGVVASNAYIGDFYPRFDSYRSVEDAIKAANLVCAMNHPEIAQHEREKKEATSSPVKPPPPQTEEICADCAANQPATSPTR